MSTSRKRSSICRPSCTLLSLDLSSRTPQDERFQPVRKLLDQLFQEVKALFLVCKTSIRLKEQKRYSSNLGLTAALSSTISPALFNLSYSTFLSASTPFSRFIEMFHLVEAFGVGHHHIARLAVVLLREQQILLLQQDIPQFVQIVVTLQSELGRLPRTSYSSPTPTRSTVNNVLPSSRRGLHELLQPSNRNGILESQNASKTHIQKSAI